MLKLFCFEVTSGLRRDFRVTLNSFVFVLGYWKRQLQIPHFSSCTMSDIDGPGASSVGVEGGHGGVKGGHRGVKGGHGGVEGGRGDAEGGRGGRGVEVKEGRATILFPSRNQVFYNPAQEFNRDLR